MDQVIQAGESYVDALRKHIPSNILALAIGCEGAINMLKDNPSAQIGLSWGVFALCVIGIPLSMWLYDGNKKWVQITCAVTSFIILELTMGGPFVRTWSESGQLIHVIGTLLTMVFVGLFAPLFLGRKR